MIWITNDNLQPTGSKFFLLLLSMKVCNVAHIQTSQPNIVCSKIHEEDALFVILNVLFTKQTFPVLSSELAIFNDFFFQIGQSHTKIDILYKKNKTSGINKLKQSCIYFRNLKKVYPKKSHCECFIGFCQMVFWGRYTWRL